MNARHESVDWNREVLARSRDEFVVAHPHLFLVCPSEESQRGLSKTTRPHRRASVAMPEVTLRLEEGQQLAQEIAEHHPIVVLALPVSSEKRRSRLGRTPDNDLVVMDLTVSKAHATVEHGVGHLSIRDMGSSNGTLVRGRKLQGGESADLAPGDEVVLGSARFHVVDAAGCWAIVRREIG